MEDEKKAPEAGAAKSGSETAEPARERLIGIDEFAAVELRAGIVRRAEAHEDADRLLVLQVDIGEAEPRQIVAGIRSDYAPDELVGRTVIIAANLKPARLRGVESRGMLLAVRGREKVLPLTVEGPVEPGTRVT